MSPSTPDELSGVRLRVEGVVQGVGFRWWTRGQAARLDLTGSVRNLPDSSVEIIAFGKLEALARFKELVAKGPPAAIVEHVHESPPPDRSAFPREFSILP